MERTWGLCPKLVGSHEQILGWLVAGALTMDQAHAGLLEVGDDGPGPSPGCLAALFYTYEL